MSSERRGRPLLLVPVLVHGRIAAWCFTIGTFLGKTLGPHQTGFMTEA